MSPGENVPTSDVMPDERVAAPKCLNDFPGNVCFVSFFFFFFIVCSFGWLLACLLHSCTIDLVPTVSERSQKGNDSDQLVNKTGERKSGVFRLYVLTG